MAPTQRRDGVSFSSLPLEVGLPSLSEKATEDAGRRRKLVLFERGVLNHGAKRSDRIPPVSGNQVSHQAFFGQINIFMATNS
ncbi:hypothetical protein [Rhizobium sp. L51/94]|uniref:hypothetical protein n=1 Tax=Rhizobium sp. L51/94 TaxID=2819999 RepID=UPI001C5AB51C|nr:hypothetical protein [Rhizobium sp. L51/94]QXZ80511.1 hypothetical protein J5274_22110 [Rhizobium sp. L51/94]